MSARQPFLPARPASRAVNLSEETSAAPSNIAQAVSNNTSSSTEKNHHDLGVKLPLHPTCFQLVVSSELTPINRSGIHSRPQYFQFQKEICAAHSKLRLHWGPQRHCSESEPGAQWRRHAGASRHQRLFHDAHICASPVHPTHYVAPRHRYGILGARIQEAFASVRPQLEERRRGCRLRVGAKLSRNRHASVSISV